MSSVLSGGEERERILMRSSCIRSSFFDGQKKWHSCPEEKWLGERRNLKLRWLLRWVLFFICYTLSLVEASWKWREVVEVSDDKISRERGRKNCPQTPSRVHDSPFKTAFRSEKMRRRWTRLDETEKGANSLHAYREKDSLSQHQMM